jgi:hypothetical protein
MRTRILQALMVLFLVPFTIAVVIGVGLMLTMVVAVGTLALIHHIFPYKTY